MGASAVRVLRLDCAPFVRGSKRLLFYWQFGFAAGISPLRRRPKGNENRRMSAVALWKPSVPPMLQCCIVAWKVRTVHKLNQFRYSSTNMGVQAKESRGRPRTSSVSIALWKLHAKPVCRGHQLNRAKGSPEGRRPFGGSRAAPLKEVYVRISWRDAAQ